MAQAEVPWERRVTTVVVTATWLALAVGIVTSLFDTEATRATINLALGASGVGALWVLVITVVPVALLRRSFVLEGLALFGVITTTVAVALTGNTDSEFLLLSITPAMMAAIHGGFRVGLGTAGLSGALLAVVTYSQEGEVIRTWPTIVLYLVVSATIAQVRRLLLDLQRSTDEMSATSAASEERLSSLEGAHGLLERLADITGTSDTSPVAVGRLALEMVCSRYPDSGAVAAISSDEGPILVARYGTTPEPSHESTIPLVVGDREVGMVKLRTPDQLAPTETDGLTTSLRPLALAFSNALLLQEITGSAVKAERVRLARELHDDIGPGLASLGLALDLALVQSATDGELTRHVEQLRGRVTEIVDEVRSTVSDLRTGRSEALRSVVDRLIGDMKPTATISFEVDERRPVRPSLAEPVYAVCGEALRNAINHSAAASIRITGWVDFDRGRIVVADDGRGFDPSELPDGHFGVVGMRERAAKADLVLDVSSGDNGTRVLVEWR